MGRSESKAAYQQSSDIAKENQEAAKGALANTQHELGHYGTNLNNYMRFGEDTFGKGGEYQRDLSTIAGGQAAANTNAIANDLTLNKLRTGSNTASYAPTVAEARRQGGRDLADTMAKGDLQRLALLSKIKSEGLDASKFPAQVQAMIYGTATGGTNSAMGNATQAAAVPGFWDQLANSLVSGAAAVGAGFAGKPA